MQLDSWAGIKPIKDVDVEIEISPLLKVPEDEGKIKPWIKPNVNLVHIIVRLSIVQSADVVDGIVPMIITKEPFPLSSASGFAWLWCQLLSSAVDINSRLYFIYIALRRDFFVLRNISIPLISSVLLKLLADVASHWEREWFAVIADKNFNEILNVCQQSKTRKFRDS